MSMHNVTHKFLWVLSFILAFNTLPAYANTSLKISNIQIIENHYSKKVLKAFFSYDGSLGDSNFLGAEAKTNIPVSGTGFHPYRVNKGANEIQFTLTRPETNSLDAFQSQSIMFTVYNRKKSIKKL